MTSPLDLMHMGHDRVIAAYEPRPGVIVDPGPSTCIETLLAGISEEPRALLLTHIHLDHAGAAGTLARRFPSLRVYVHSSGARHLADPAKLVASAARLYGDDMERLWGEVAAVPAEALVALEGGEEVLGFDVAHVPGHARHHVAYRDRESNDAYVGDTAGVRIRPHTHTVAPTPPPDIDVEAWRRSLDTLRGWHPARLMLTHFGPADDPDAQLERLENALIAAAEVASRGSRLEFEAWFARGAREAVGEDEAARYLQAVPGDQSWLGLERYWAKRREADPAR